MIFYPLASSSKGNAYWVTDGETAILIECGLSLKELRKRSPEPLSSLDAVFVSHEHGDHAKCAEQLVKKGVPVYMSEGTARALQLDDAICLEVGETVRVGALRVLPFETFHNTKQPFGFIVYDTRSHEKLLFAIDTVNCNIIVPDLTHIAIECNYSENLICRLDRLPEKTKDRIRRSHMEVNTAIKYVKKLDLDRVKTIFLLHMSSSSGDAERFRAMFRREFPDIKIIVCDA